MRTPHLRRGLQLFEPGRTSGRLLRGLGTSFATNLIAACVAFASSLLFARALGGEQFGIFTYVNSWLNIAVLTATLGLDAALVRFLPQYGTNRTGPPCADCCNGAAAPRWRPPSASPPSWPPLAAAGISMTARPLD